tara:strand:- start:14264 stop:17890 length:3627 start_codon:yes stop_codon:yes gene_type:complete
MPDLDPERVALAAELQRQIGSENELTPVQARAFVRGLQTGWRVPTIQWRQEETHSQYDDAKRLLNAASIFRSVEGKHSQNARFCYRRAAELFEWLSRGGDDSEKSAPLELLAAAAYQLGGSPAMSAALLSISEQDSPGERLFAYFLRADFDGVIGAVTDFWRENLDITDREAPQRILQEDGDDKVGWFATVELVRVLGLLADSIRRGEVSRFELAKRKLEAIDRVASRSFDEDISLLVTLLLEVADAYVDANIYGPIRQLGEINPERVSRLERFARGQFSRGRGILWTSQIDGLKRLIEEESFALCTPTGSGKTLVANLAIVKELLLNAGDDEGALALYLVPSRALASEVEAKLSSELSNDVIVTGLYGGTDWGVTDYWLEADEPTVLIATVEKADALMRYLGPLLLRRLRLLIVDEAHQVVPEDNDRTQDDFAEHSSRPLRLEAFVSRLLSRAPEIVRVALTAVAGGAATPVARWIEGREEAEPVGSNYRSTRQIIGSFEVAPDRSGQMLLEILNGKPLFVRGRDDEAVYINVRTPPMPALPASMRNSVFRFTQLDVLWTAQHLIEGGRRVLISVAQQPERTMGWFKDALLLPAWEDAPQFERPNDEDDLRRFVKTREACVDYCGEESYEVALLDHGIATNHGQMPQRIRRLMVDLIDRGICPITVATATLTEGVNLPFDLIFVTALKRRSFNSVLNQQIENPISTSEFRNLAGRAGRPGAGIGMEGITLVAVPVRPSSSARGTIPTQRRQIAQMQEEWRTLRQSLLAEELERVDIDSPLALLMDGIAERARQLLNIEGDEFLDWLEGVIPPEISDEAGRASQDEEARLADSIDELDGVLLSALEELQRIDEVGLEGTEAEAALSAIWQKSFTAFASAQEAWMEDAFIRRGQAIIDELYPDRDERSRLYQYGFTPYVGRRFETVVPTVLEYLRNAGDYGELDDAARLALFEELGEQVEGDRGYGFRVRSTATDQEMLDNWTDILKWWMRGPEAEAPAPENLRSWQRFVSENLEFRLGVGLGAVVARAWSDGVDGALIVPSLEAWRETTELPWFGFWARELIRWGTLDPFVAFALAEGLVGTRDEGEELRLEFDEWLDATRDAVVSEDRIDPQLFLEWKRSLEGQARRPARRRRLDAQLDGTNGERGQYSVIPVVSDESIHWIDAAGFLLARSQADDFPFQGLVFRDDFELRTDREQPVVRRTFSGLR